MALPLKPSRSSFGKRRVLSCAGDAATSTAGEVGVLPRHKPVSGTDAERGALRDEMCTFAQVLLAGDRNWRSGVAICFFTGRTVPGPGLLSLAGVALGDGPLELYNM